MTSPLYGNQHSKKFNADFFIKTYSSDVTRPATAAAALTEFYGTPATFTLDMLTTPAVPEADQYVVIPTPSQVYCVWLSVAGAGTKPPAPAECTAYLEANTATLAVDVVGNALATAINTTDEATASYDSTTDVLTVTAVQGGTTVSGSTNITDAIFTETVAGVGDWAKIGGVAEDYSVEVSPNEIRDTKGNVIVTYEDVDVNFEFMNVDERNIAIMKAFNRTQTSIALVDNTNSASPKIYAMNDLTFNATLTPAGDTARMPMKLSKRVEEALTGTSYWSYNADLV